MFFVPWPWHVKTQAPADSIAVPMLATNSWRLMLLFVVSGFATRAIIARSPKLGALARERSVRLLIPLAFGIIVIMPPQPWVELVAQHGFARDYLSFWMRDYFDLKAINGVVVPTWNHLWFVAYLWVYTLLLLGGLAVIGRSQPFMQRAFDRLHSGAGILIIPLVWLLVARLLLFPGMRENNGLIDDALGHAVFFFVFLFGFALGGSRTVLTAAAARWKKAALIYVVAYAIEIAFELRWPGNIPVPDEYRAAFVAARTVQGWAAVVALLDLADCFLNHDHPWRARLTEAVFPST